MTLRPVIEAGDVRRPLAELSGPVTGGEDHRGRTIGDRREIVTTERLAHVLARQQPVDVGIAPHLGVGVVLRVTT